MLKLDAHDRRSRGRDPALPRLLGGQLALDFANTIEDPTGPRPRDFLRGYADLVGWGWHAGVLTDEQVAQLGARAERDPAAAADALAAARRLREAIDQTFRALARDMSPERPALATLEHAHRAALAHASLAAGDPGFDWVWREDDAHLDRPLWPVARLAVELLVDGDPERVKECVEAAGGCSWLFYDTSKNASRRWCSMEGCGTQVKMRRYHARRRQLRG